MLMMMSTFMTAMPVGLWSWPGPRPRVPHLDSRAPVGLNTWRLSSLFINIVLLLRSYLDTLVVRIAHKDPSIIENNNTLEVVDIIIFTAIITIDVTMIIISTCGLVNSPFPRPRLPTARIKSSSIVFLLEPRLVHDLQW